MMIEGACAMLSTVWYMIASYDVRRPPPKRRGKERTNVLLANLLFWIVSTLRDLISYCGLSPVSAPHDDDDDGPMFVVNYAIATAAGNLSFHLHHLLQKYISKFTCWPQRLSKFMGLTQRDDEIGRKIANLFLLLFRCAAANCVSINAAPH